MPRRVIFVMIDGAGVGALPDAANYGDAGSDTLGNLSRVLPLKLPFLQRMGLGNVTPLAGVAPVGDPLALVGRLAPSSAGKDTTVGHWEHMGLVTSAPFPTYPDGFPVGLIRVFSDSIGREVLGNRVASGTAIIAELGERHLATGYPIVYTSADSVFQVAAHEDVVPVPRLYEWCTIARGLLSGEHAVARVIARPFSGRPGSFVRTRDRRDFSLPPPGPLYLDRLSAAGIPTVALGKIGEIFVGRGITHSLKVGSNVENLALLTDLVAGRSSAIAWKHGLLMTNLVDFDMLWGHRNDVDGFAGGLAQVEVALERLVQLLGLEDLLIVSADHGVDPTTVSTDHSREYVPLLVLPPPAEAPSEVYEGGFSDTGATVYEYLTGQEPKLEGRPVGRLDPQRGWRRYTQVQESTSPSVAGMVGRVGAYEAATAGRWLRENLGPAPKVAVVLGSGLAFDTTGASTTEVPYVSIPHWPVGGVPGHPQHLRIATWKSASVAVLAGRVHQYEGFDLSEEQHAVRSLARWGVPKVLLASAAGAVQDALSPGSVLPIAHVLDLHHLSPAGDPELLVATSRRLQEELRSLGTGPGSFCDAIHASVPGPQYETPAELRLLRSGGVATVSMSPAGELRAATDESLETAVVAVVTNAGDTSHTEVLAGCEAARAAFSALVETILAAWGVAR